MTMRVLTVYRAIIAEIRKYLFSMATDIAAHVLILPFAILAGWLLFGADLRNGYAMVTRDFSDMQWMAVYAISGGISLSVFYYLIQLPVTAMLKIKTAVSDETSRDRLIKWLWWMGAVSGTAVGDSTKRPMTLSYVVHTAALFLRFYGLIAIFVCVGAVIASADYSLSVLLALPDMASLIPFVAAELVKAAI